MNRLRTLLSLLVVFAFLGFALAVLPGEGGVAPVVMADGETDDHADDEDDNGDNDENKNKDKDKDKDKDEKNENKNGKQGSGEQGGSFTPAEPYRVEVACAYDDAEDETTCTFTGIAPEGAKDVSHVDLPAEEVCADVVGGEHEYVDPDPNTRVVGYKSKGSEGTFTLVMTGQVTTAGTATYWFKTGDGVFPATGPGLSCNGETVAAPEQPTDPAAQSTATAAAAPATSTPPATDTGAIIVQLYACAEEPASADADWYGLCEPGIDGVRLELALQQESGYDPAGTGTSSADGAFRFSKLAPGTYRLDTPETAWCHAESDHVDAQGNLIVEPGAEVTVWIFFCGAAESR